MANLFWVGGAGTWDSANTTSWSTTTGGAGGASVPGTGDVAIFDANSGGGTVIVDSPNGAGVVTVQQITCGEFTGTLDFATNNNDVTLSVAFNGSGTGTRTINIGSGTWTFTSTGGNLVTLSTTTNLTFSAGSSSVVFNANTANIRNFIGGGQTWGQFTISANATGGVVNISNANTFSGITVNEGTTLLVPQGTTTTISGALTMNGTSSSQVGLLSSGPQTNAATISVGSASTITWGGICRITKAGAGSITATDSLDLNGNSGITITVPSGGGGTIYKNKVYGG